MFGYPRSWADPNCPVVAVDQFIAKNRVPHLLFYGPPGTGKTSTILAVARKIYGTKEAMKNNCLEVGPAQAWVGKAVRGTDEGADADPVELAAERVGRPWD